ncbi:Uncharacterized protein QTN25_008525 [Entamoeba marina]
MSDTPSTTENTSSSKLPTLSSPKFEHMYYNYLTKDLQEKYNQQNKPNKSSMDVEVSQAINILITTLVIATILGFIGYGYGGITYAAFGGAIGLFIGLVVDTTLLIIYSNPLDDPSKIKKQSKLIRRPKID